MGFPFLLLVPLSLNPPHSMNPWNLMRHTSAMRVESREGTWGEERKRPKEISLCRFPFYFIYHIIKAERYNKGREEAVRDGYRGSVSGREERGL